MAEESSKESSKESGASPQDHPSLADFCAQLDDYTPTIPDAVTLHYLQQAGFNTDDPRLVRLVSLAAQKFISEIINDSLQHNKLRNTAQNTRKAAKDKRMTLTLEDLAPALAELGINLRKPLYFT